MRRKESVFKTLDWLTVVIYLCLVVFGWFSICGASYDYSEHDLLDFSTRAGKQFVWIICSFGLAGMLLMLDDLFYETYAYLIYGVLLLLLVVTIFIAPDTKGSRSWLILGPVSLQPAEFAKFATALALARIMNVYGFVLKTWRNALTVGLVIVVPMLLIIAQRETGSALVYLSFFLVLYREGMPGTVLCAGVCAVLYFVLGIRYAEVMLADTPTPLGQFLVLTIALLFSVGVVRGRHCLLGLPVPADAPCRLPHHAGVHGLLHRLPVFGRLYVQQGAGAAPADSHPGVAGLGRRPQRRGL